MRHIPSALYLLLLVPFLFACNKDLHVNADWKDITVIYGLLDQNQDTTFIKITRAFLGEGNALQFAKIPDSSNYPDKLDVRLEAWSGKNLIRTWNFDTTTIHTKSAGQDTIFYYPDQLVYYSLTSHLDSSFVYWLKVKHRNTGVVDSAVAGLIYGFQLQVPDPYFKTVEYNPYTNSSVKWTKTYGGKRYQLVIRIVYRETIAGVQTTKSVDWVIFNSFQVADPDKSQVAPLSYTFPGSGFYSTLKSNIPINELVSSRQVLWVNYIFSIASDDLNTYIEATQPSNSIVQERPSFSNIFNGIGLFSSRLISEIDTIRIGDNTIEYIHNDPELRNRGF